MFCAGIAAGLGMWILMALFLIVDGAELESLSQLPVSASATTGSILLDWKEHEDSSATLLSMSFCTQTVSK
jgi:hypothetical protein